MSQSKGGSVLGNRAESQDLIDLGNRIRKRRQEIHLSQEVLAEKAGISPNTISRIEGGQTAMSIEIFRKLAVILKTDAGTLLAFHYLNRYGDISKYSHHIC